MKDRNVEFPNRFRMTKVEGTDDIYDLIPAPGEVIALGDTFSKANMLPDSIPAALGLKMGNPQVKDALNVLANIGNVHVWQRVQTYSDPVPEVPAGYTLGEVETDVLLVSVTSNPGNQSKSVLLYYDSSLNVTNDGIISVSSSNYVYANVTNMNAVNRIVGQFVSVETIGTAVEKTDLKEGEIYYVPEDCEISYSLLESPLYIRLSKVQRVTGYPYTPAIPAGTHTDYLTSTDPNAYTEGTVDRTTITYLGQLGDPGAKIEVGSYVGTGTYDSSYPNSLTFGFAPKIVELLFMTSKNVGGNYSKSEDLTGNGFARTQDFMVADRLTTEYAQGEGLGYNAYSSYGKKSPDGKTFYWYSSDAGAQCNRSEYVYYYIAIG